MRALATCLLLLLQCCRAQRHTLLSVGHATLDATNVVSAADQRRPIITGCLEECGTVDQACVTQCQVCVEYNRCPSLIVNCTSCLLEARDAKVRNLNVASLAIDSGGVSMQREGIRQRLEKAKLEAMEAKRRLQQSRSVVLQAQRDAEWAAQRSREEVVALRAARLELRTAKDKAARWELRQAKKVKKMRSKAAELRAQQMRTLSHLRSIRQKLYRARLHAKQHPDDPHASHSVAIFGRSWQHLRWKVEAQQRAVAKAEEDLRKKQKDDAWVLKSIREDVQTVAKGLQKEMEDLHTTRDTERAARKRLNGAKQSYRDVAEESHELGVESAELRDELRAIKLPSYLPNPDLE
mmetsp:Transcript_57211/g.147156  ORF Transcript_57211/g.147156 Transcript_57211/m.147156 type:complete len:351 (+) Transcript_57211:130-1182(+)